MCQTSSLKFRTARCIDIRAARAGTPRSSDAGDLFALAAPTGKQITSNYVFAERDRRAKRADATIDKFNICMRPTRQLSFI